MVQQGAVIGFADDAAGGAQLRVVEDLGVGDFQAAVDEVAVAGHGPQFLAKALFDVRKIGKEFCTDVVHVGAQCRRVPDLFFLGVARQFFIVVTGFAAVVLDLAHQLDVEGGEPEVETGRDPVLFFDVEQLARGAQVGVDVVTVNEHFVSGAIALLN